MNTPACTKCPLHKHAKTVLVPGRGSDAPTIMFVGTAPGWTEDKNGESFTGKPGKKLMSLLAENGIDKDTCRFTNLVKCIPWQKPKARIEDRKTRLPKEDEISSCQNYLLKEISLCEPKIIMPLGKIAAAYFLPNQAKGGLKISKVSGHTFNWEHPITEDIYTILPTLSPSALLGSSHWLGKITEAIRYAQKLSTGKTVADIFDECEYEYLDTLDKVEEYVDMVIAKYEADPTDPFNVISIDAETAFNDPLPEDYVIPRGAIFLNPFNPYHVLVSLQFSHDAKKGALVPLWHKDSPFRDYASIAKIAMHVQRLVDVVPVIGQNFKFDWKILYVMLGVEVKKFFFDSMLAQFLVYQKSHPLNLESMAGLYVEMPFFKREMHKSLSDLPEEIRHMGNVDIEVLIRYGCGDSDAVYRLLQYWHPILVENGLWDVYQDILRDATITYARIESNGMLIDKDRLAKLKVDYKKELAALLKSLRASDYIKTLQEIRLKKYYLKEESEYAKENAKRDVIGKPHVKRKKYTAQAWEEREAKIITKHILFKPSSPDQLRLLFYDDDLMGFSSKGKGLTKTRQISADKNARTKILEDAHQELAWFKENDTDDEDSIEALTECVEVVENINEWVGKNKLFTAYIKKAPELIHDKGDIERAWPIPLPEEICDWSFHANFKIHGADTGRSSCEHPNLQQMPFKSLIKWMFVSRWKKQGGVLLQGDYSQAELRVLAKLCDEKEMLAAFNRGEDIHMFVATLVFGALGVPADQITKAMRRIAKRASFGIVYGQGAKALAYGFGTSVDEAKQIIKTLYRVFPNLRGWMDSKVQEAKDEGLVTTPMGRIRWIRHATSRDEFLAAEAARKAVNTPIQSAASDWLLCSLNEVSKRFLEKGLKSLIVASIHDSIMVDVYPGEMLDVMDIMHREMVVRLPKRFAWIKGVLPKVDFEFGVNWRDMTEIVVQPDYSYKIKGKPLEVKRNLKQLVLCGDVDQLDVHVDEDNPEESWVAAEIEF